MVNIKISPWIYLSIGVLCIAFSAIFVKLANVNGVSAAFYRMFIAGIVLLPYYFVTSTRKFKFRHAAGAFLCGMFFASDVSMWNVAIMRTDATVSTLLGNLAPLWTGVLGFFFFKIKPSKYYWLGTFIAFTGVIILLDFSKLILLKVNAGFFLAIAASVFYALYLLTSRVIRQSFDTVSFMMFTLLGGIFTTYIFAQITDAPLWGFSLHSWLSLIGLALVSHLMGWLVINYALGHVPSTEASLALLSQSVCTAFLASFILNEKILLHQIVGGLIVLLGIALVYIKRNKTVV